MDLKKTDSSSAMQSLAMYDADSDEEQNVSKEEEIQKDTENEVDNISDDEEDHHIGSVKSSTKRPHSPSPKSASSVEIQEPPKRDKKAMRLVSYATDDMDDEEARLTSSDEEEEEGDDDDDGTIKDLKKVQGLDYATSLNSELASSLSRQVRHMSSDEISLPPEPTGKCSKQLQDKITRSYHKMRTTGLDLNESIQRRKDFRNPSIYEKLIEHCGIDEKGTNYPPDIYDPHFWGKESFYDELAKVQKVEMDKREKEKKDRTKIEFLSGTKKGGVVESGDKRKTKWDSANNKNVSISSVSVTSSASGNKPIVISAMGTIKKEKK